MIELTLGPLHYYWPRERLERFYAEAAGWPVERVYLGETVCGRRRALGPEDWLALAEGLAAAGKEVVISTLALIEAESELATLARLCANGRFAVEANDMAALMVLGGERSFVAGPHINAYNAETLEVLAAAGARRWVPPVEIALDTVAELHAARPAGLETEVFAFGHLPLAFSARCFTARALGLGKDECGFRCDEYPHGMALATQEEQALFRVNGVQIQSALPCNLIGELERLAAIGVEALRISPLEEGTGEVVAAFRAVLAGERSPGEALAALAPLAPEGWCNGYAHGEPGMAQVPVV